MQYFVGNLLFLERTCIYCSLITELSRLTRIEKAVKNTTIFVIYKVLVYIHMSQPTKCFGFFLVLRYTTGMTRLKI